jgi:ABC-type antimicrobial peptide transport system permease subunit
MSQERLVAGLAGSFAALAALLTALGLYGVTAYQVSSRRMEMGVRLALGGSSRQVIALVLRQVLWLVLIGAAAGLVLCLWLSPLANSLLYGLGPRDPATLAASAALLVSVAALAAWWPARLASRITLTELLRPRG